MAMQYKIFHPNQFNKLTVITTADDDTPVVLAKAGLRIFITDLVITTVQTAAIGSFTLTDDGGTAIFGPVAMQAGANAAAFIFNHSFETPLVNEARNDQVEMDKTAGEDDWNIFISGYYAP